MQVSNKIYIRDLRVDMGVGIYPHEIGHAQPVLINAEIQIDPAKRWHEAKIAETVSYDKLVERIEKVSAKKHYALLEEFLENVTDEILAGENVSAVKISVEKPNIIKNAKSVGVEIIRSK